MDVDVDRRSSARANGLRAELRAAGVFDAHDDEVHRVAFSADASLYRVRPLVVAYPRIGR